MGECVVGMEINVVWLIELPDNTQGRHKNNFQIPNVSLSPLSHTGTIITTAR